jgi:signal transduction histidine kinase
MRTIIRQLERQVNATVDWFIPAEAKLSGDFMQGARMFLFSHLFGPFLGLTISFSMLYIRGEADLSWWVFFFAVIAFWPFPAILRLTGWYVPLALISIENLMFCIFWGCYNYGGVSSPILPWLITVPLLGFFYLRGRLDRIIVGCMILANLVVFYLIYSWLGFPETVPMDGLVALGLVSTFCASVYVSMMALYYGNIVSSQAELEQEVQRHLETEQMLRDATGQAERAMLAKSEFLAKMSHELRNPLNSIIGYSEMLIEDITATETQEAKDLASIKDAGHTLLKLINDLLDLSKLEAGRMEIQMAPIELTQHIEESTGIWSARIAESGNRFIVNKPTDPVFFMGDHTILKRVIDNLLSNATKFTKNGYVTLAADSTDDAVVISVQDTGIGIGEEQLTTLFETFRSSEHETSSNYGEHARLGLPLAYRYCRLMNGELSLETKLGKGSRFMIRLPRLMVDEEELPIVNKEELPRLIVNEEEPSGCLLFGLQY